MSISSCRIDASIIEIFDSIWIDTRGKWKRRPEYSVFKSCDQFSLSSKAIDLPCSKTECNDWNEDWSGQSVEASSKEV